MKDFLLWLWQLPQNLVGFFIQLYYAKHDAGKYKIHKKDGIRYMRTPSFPGGVSLGRYVFLQSRYWKREKDYALDEAHEYGHCVQSQFLGWFYLLIIGIPSGLHNLWHRSHRSKDYYAYWCEKWADELGGVQRTSDGTRYVSMN